MSSIRLDVYSHFIKVTGFSPKGKEALLQFCRGIAQYGLVRVGHNRFTKQMIRVFVGVTADRSEFHFHFNQYKDLVGHLQACGFNINEIKTVVHPASPGVDVDLTLINGIVERDYQVPIGQYIVDNGHIKALTLQTGKGKTACALIAASRIGKRTLLSIKGMYVDKWTEDVATAYGLKSGELMVVKGGKQLRAIIELAKAGEMHAKFIIITNKTLQMFLQDYERFNGSNQAYGCSPVELFELLGIGFYIRDEVHQDFHLNFRLDLYTHVSKTLNLSATLDPDDPFIRRMYETAYPLSMRYQGGTYDKYIAVEALTYSLNDTKRVRWQNFSRKSYSHVIFEQSLMKQPVYLNNYLDLITKIVHQSYVSVREAGQRMLIFAATKEMCTIIQSHLRKRYHDLKIGRYLSEDEYEILLNSDISVSTLKSAGTAVDVPGLRVTLMTDALGSRQLNEQALGRTRRLKDWPHITPKFLYLVCLQIPKHVEYHTKKYDIFKGKVISHKEFNTGMRV